jgi:hypothetical protein
MQAQLIESWSAAAEGLGALASMLLLRFLSGFVYLAASARAPRWARVGAVGYCAAVVALGAVHVSILAWQVAGLGFYALAASALYRFARGRTPRGGLEGFFACCTFFLLYVVAPANIIPGGAALPFLSLGWEMMLKSFSYVMESQRGSTTLRDTLFFHLVDPTLVFEERRALAVGAADRRWSRARIGQGLAALVVGQLVSLPLMLVLDAVAARGLWMPLLLVFAGVTRLLLEYASHSGTASVQLAVLRLAGISLPERYVYPLAAKSPVEFWQRWNTYVGAWARRYLHFPIALRAARLPLPWQRSIGAAASAVAVFGAVGVLHDAYASVRIGEIRLHATVFFVANGALVVAWLGTTRLSVAPRIARWLRSTTTRHVRAWSSQLAFGALFVLLVGSLR